MGRALPGTREQACSCLMMWLSSPWRLAPLEFLRASNMFSASTVPSPSASNWAKAYNTRHAIKSHLLQIGTLCRCQCPRGSWGKSPLTSFGEQIQDSNSLYFAGRTYTSITSYTHNFVISSLFQEINPLLPNNFRKQAVQHFSAGYREPDRKLESETWLRGEPPV